jgi:PhzF family phenazine biosynthesis protein
MKARIWTVDAFADKPFSGNPAGVCLLEAPAPEAWMQSVAAEMNLSETAFLVPHSEGWRLRWFTPLVEVDLCGHATLASAHVLWSEGFVPGDMALRFDSRSGVLRADRGEDGLIWLDFPEKPGAPIAEPPGFAEALGAKPRAVYGNGMDYLAEVESERVVAELRPDVAALKTVPCRGIIVTSKAERPGVDFVSRFFAPAVGIDEDPVTGSAHCMLAPYWAARLGRTELTGYQASRRGGTVLTKLSGGRVALGGRAVTVLGGELAV